jgi:hypothetical protein
MSDRTADAVLSACVIQERFGLGSNAAGNDAFRGRLASGDGDLTKVDPSPRLSRGSTESQSRANFKK